MSVTVTEIRTDLAKLGFLPSSRPLADADSLMDSGAIDSLRLMEFVTHIERKYGVTVDQDDLVPENFDSIEGIAQYIAARNGNGKS
jgi:acyl carrier protein